MNRRQSIAVPSQSGNNKENGTRVAKIKRAQSIGGPMDAHKGGIVGADGLSPRRRKRRSMVPRKSILKMHNEEDEQTMEITQVVGGIGADMTMGRKSLARRVSFAAMAQVRMFEPTVNSNATASSPRSSPANSSPANPPAPEASTSKRSPAPTRRANSEEVGEASMELDDESERSMEAGDSFGAEEEPFDGGEGGGEDSMELTDTYQIGTPSRRRSSAPMAPLPPLDRNVDRRDLSRASDIDPDPTEELSKDKDKDSGEYMVKTGKSIVPRRKSEAWAELQSLTHAGEELDDDSTASTMASDFHGGFIPASQDSQSGPFSSQGTYATSSSQQSATDRDMGLDDALSRLRAARQSMGAGEADISIDDDDDNRSSSSGDFEGQFDDEERTMDVTAITGGLRFRTDDDEDEEAEAESASAPAPDAPTAPAFVFTEQPEASSATSNPASNVAPNLPTFAVEPPSPAAPEPQAPTVPAAPITFAIPSSPKPAVAKPTSLPVPAPTFAVDAAPGPSTLTAPSNPEPAPSPRARSPLTFEVSQSPVRPPPVSWSPRNAPGPFEFKLPSGSTPRRSSSAGGLNVISTTARATTPVPAGTPKAVDTPTRATSAPPTPKRPREEAQEEGSARKKQALAAPEQEKKGAAKPPRRRSFAPRMSMSILGRAGRSAQDAPPAAEPSPPRVPSPPPAPVVEPPAPQSPSPVREPSPITARASPPRPTTPPSANPVRQAPASPSLTRGSPKPSASLEEIRVASPLRSRVSAVGTKSPAHWGASAQNELELDDVPAISASDFLRMTRISFMDGLTVKRRSTVGLGILGRRQSGENQPVPGVADYITAMTVGIPQLETFNYASKELKEYISNGKKAIRILEDDLDANNPYLFKEYLASGEDDRRAIEETLGGHKEAMRMRSKMSWYKWRHNFVSEMQGAADRETELLQQDLASLRAIGDQLAEPIPSLREQHAKLKAQLAAERAAVEASKDCDPEIMSELRTGITEQNTQIESYRSDIQSSTAKLEKLKAKLEEAENDKQALLNQMRVHQEQLDALHPTVEIVNLREEFDKLQRLHLWHAVKLEDKYIELVYDSRYRVQMKCAAFKPIPSGCRILAVPPKGKQVDQFPGLSELVLDLSQAMIRQTTELNLKKVVRMLGRLWTSVSHMRCNLRLLAMKYPITIIRTDNGFGFKAITRVRFPGSKGLAKITFIAEEQHIRDWGRQLHTLGVDVDVVFGKLDRNLLVDVIKERISDSIIEESYGLLLDACADAIACAEE